MVNSVLIAVKVVPGSSRNRVVGRLGPALKVQVTAAPEAGKANAVAVRLLAEFFDLKPSQITLISGASAPRKQFRLTGITDEQLQKKLAKFT